MKGLCGFLLCISLLVSSFAHAWRYPVKWEHEEIAPPKWCDLSKVPPGIVRFYQAHVTEGWEAWRGKNFLFWTQEDEAGEVIAAGSLGCKCH